MLSELPPDTYLGKLMRQLCKTDADFCSEDDLVIILDFEEEQFRLGNFEKIFPCINNVNYYNQFFEYSRHANNLLLRYLTIISPKLNQHHLCYVPSNNSVMLPGNTLKQSNQKSKQSKANYAKSQSKSNVSAASDQTLQSHMMKQISGDN